MKTLLIAALAILGGVMYAGWQHGFYDCKIELWILCGLAIAYLTAAGVGAICGKFFRPKDD